MFQSLASVRNSYNKDLLQCVQSDIDGSLRKLNRNFLLVMNATFLKCSGKLERFDKSLEIPCEELFV